MKKKIMIIGGTRPEFIKLVSLIKRLNEEPNKFEVTVVNTEQHNKLTKQVLRLFNIKPKYSLNVMKNRQSLSHIVSNVVKRLDVVIKKEKPDLVIVQGDTSTSLSAALCAFNNKVKILHIEAGVRAPDISEPYPEEGNRRMITQISDYHLCQAEQHCKNLIKEGKTGFVIGNTAIDALREVLKGLKLAKKKQILITMHRRENWGEPINRICTAISELAKTFNNYTFIISCHPNPVVSECVKSKLSNIPNIKIIQSLRFDKFVKTMAESRLIITDSGGIPQEAPAFKVPVLIMRDLCENQEILDMEVARLVGTETDNIIYNASLLLNYTEEHKKMTEGGIPYYRGSACGKIAKYIKEIFFGDEINKQ